MANMGYCRFRNTLNDLQDCYDNTEDVEMEDEVYAKKALIKLCKKIVEEYDWT